MGSPFFCNLLRQHRLALEAPQREEQQRRHAEQNDGQRQGDADVARNRGRSPAAWSGCGRACSRRRGSWRRTAWARPHGPASRPRRAIMTKRKSCQGLAPRMAAASSTCGPMASKAIRAARTKNGAATNSWAITTAAVVKGSEMPAPPAPARRAPSGRRRSAAKRRPPPAAGPASGRSGIRSCRHSNSQRVRQRRSAQHGNQGGGGARRQTQAQRLLDGGVVQVLANPALAPR